MSSAARVTRRRQAIALALLLSHPNAGLPQVDAPGKADAGEASTAEEIVVTGTRIRGTEGAGSKVIVIDRGQIDASGYGRVEDVLSMVTQNFSRTNGAVSGGTEVDNPNRGAEVQLRGLGAGTTLMLVNGQRQGASGFQGYFTDVSTIPASAIERIEILPEGAEALYGSDAIGGVVNVILRRDFEGFETRLRAGSAGGDARERTVAQLWGHAWPGGHAILGLQYDDSVSLACQSRAYCAANADFRRYGGTDLRGYGGNPGTVLDPITLAPIAAIPRGQDGTHLFAAQLIPGAVNHPDIVANNDILPGQLMRSLFMSSSLDLTDQWELLADGRYSSRMFRTRIPQPADYFTVPTSNAFNHFGAPVVVAYDFTPDVGPVVDSGPTDIMSVSTTAKRELSRDWQLSISGAWSKARSVFLETNLFNAGSNADAIGAALASSDPGTALNLFGEGPSASAAALAASLRQDATYRGLNVFDTTSVNLMADGPLLKTPAGVTRIAAGVDFRKEHSVGLNVLDEVEDRSRRVFAGFLEAAIPILPAPQGSSASRMEWSLAGRVEKYSDAGSTFNPKVGLSWRPVQMLKLRSTWGTSLRAPPFYWSNPDQIGNQAIFDVPDPKSPNGFTRALVLFGPVAGMKPETARTLTVGLDITSPSRPEATLALTYFDVHYRGKIRNPGPMASIFLTHESQFAALIARNPTPAQIAAACTLPLFGGDCNQHLGAILDNRIRNLVGVTTRGIDATLDYSIDTATGKWTYGLGGTYTFEQSEQIVAWQQANDLVDTVGNPLKLRVTSQLSWSRAGWTVQSLLRYSGRYRESSLADARRVSAWTTIDLNIGFKVSNGSGWLAHSQLNLGVVNVFGRRPPFVNQFDLQSGTLGYDPANATPLGRQVSLQWVKGWGQ